MSLLGLPASYTLENVRRAAKRMPVHDVVSACWEASDRIAETLRGPCCGEAVALLREGFLVPAPAALTALADQAARSYAARGPDEPRVDRVTPDASLAAILGLAATWRGLQDAVDLSWSAAWSSLLGDQSVMGAIEDAVALSWLVSFAPDADAELRQSIMNDYISRT